MTVAVTPQPGAHTLLSAMGLCQAGALNHPSPFGVNHSIGMPMAKMFHFISFCRDAEGAGCRSFVYKQSTRQI